MKSIILQEIIKKEYYLAVRYFRRGSVFDLHEEELSIDSKSNEVGRVTYKYVHDKWKVIEETNEFYRELKINESIHIQGNDYSVKKVSHSSDGSILYYLNETQTIEDEESKLKAEDNLKKRLEYLQEVEKQKQKEEEQRSETLLQEEVAQMPTPAPKPKWYEFWKIENK